MWSAGNNNGTIRDIMQLIQKCGIFLIQWNKSIFCHVQQNLAKANPLKLAQDRHPVESSSEEIPQARKEVHTWLERDEIMWKQ